MKKQITIDKSFCDFCGKEASGYSQCMCCGKDLCYGCLKTEAKEYPHSVYCSGSGDGLYCLQCDRNLRDSDDNLHAAYRKIESLRNELKGWSEDFKKRCNDAEAEVIFQFKV